MITLWLGIKASQLTAKLIVFFVSLACKILISIAFFYASYIIVWRIGTEFHGENEMWGSILIKTLSLFAAALCISSASVRRAFAKGFLILGVYALSTGFYLFSQGGTTELEIPLRYMAGMIAFIIGLFVYFGGRQKAVAVK